MKELIPQEFIEKKIYFIRGHNVMMDRDLAELYDVTTRRLNEQVKRNIKRFPEDFMFQLNEKEFKNWKSQIATSNPSFKKGVRKRPYAFTEQGVAMLSSVLNSERAIQVNIVIMRIFVKLRGILSMHKDLVERLNQLENKFEKHDKEIETIFDAIRQLMIEPEKPKRKIGF